MATIQNVIIGKYRDWMLNCGKSFFDMGRNKFNLSWLQICML